MNIKIVAFFVLLGNLVLGQSYESDALRFSTNNYSGSARFVAVGGAFSSVGADMSSFSYNPAGVGMYKSSVIQSGIGVNYSKYQSTYLDNTVEDVRVSANIPSLGAVFASKKPSENGLFKGMAFGIGFNRLSEFNYNETIKAFNTNPGTSITSNWTNEMNNTFGSTNVDLDQSLVSPENLSFESQLAYFGYLSNFDSISLVNTGLAYTSPVMDSIDQTRFSEVNGGKNEIVISGGANYLDKLFFGATIGIPFLNYKTESRFIEEDGADSDVNTFFNEFQIKQEYEKEGVGFNLKLGVIYKINDWIRVGGAFQTPERMSITESYTTSMVSNVDQPNFALDPLLGEFDYQLRLPWRGNVGASLFIKKNGFISVDYEAVGYSSMKYTFGTDFKELSDDINTDIKAKYQVGHNVRVGGEAVIKKLRLRAGYNYIGSPIRSEFSVEDYDFTRHVVSGGFGFLFSRIALDFAYQHNMSKQFEQPYSVENNFVSGVNKKINQGTAVVSVAYKLN